ncbi:MAG: DUF3800 domain-containing protein [Dehalococcoidales bacterium]|nr:DUF3800 domain-containing protein [Dehalococcoidales bacterium]
MNIIFADYAGDIKDNSQPVVVLAALIVSEEELALRVVPRYNRIRNYVADWGIDVNRNDFEFHTGRVFNTDREWRGISESQKRDLLHRISRIVTCKRGGRTRIIPHVHFALVLIDKNNGGLESVQRFSKDIVKYKDEVLTLLSEKEKNAFIALASSLIKRKGPGQLASLTGVLFGLTTGLMHWVGLKDDNQLVVDKQFVKGTKAWQVLFRILAAAWPIAKSRFFFPGWPARNQPDWHLGNTVNEIDSSASYGVQLADFLAYTAMRSFVRGPYDLSNEVSIVQRDKFVPFEGYKGILLAVSKESRRTHIYIKDKHHKPLVA